MPKLFENLVKNGALDSRISNSFNYLIGDEKPLLDMLPEFNNEYFHIIDDDRIQLHFLQPDYIGAKVDLLFTQIHQAYNGYLGSERNYIEDVKRAKNKLMDSLREKSRKNPENQDLTFASQWPETQKEVLGGCVKDTILGVTSMEMQGSILNSLISQSKNYLGKILEQTEDAGQINLSLAAHNTIISNHLKSRIAKIGDINKDVFGDFFTYQIVIPVFNKLYPSISEKLAGNNCDVDKNHKLFLNPGMSLIGKVSEEKIKSIFPYSELNNFIPYKDYKLVQAYLSPYVEEKLNEMGIKSPTQRAKMRNALLHNGNFIEETSALKENPLKHNVVENYKKCAKRIQEMDLLSALYSLFAKEEKKTEQSKPEKERVKEEKKIYNPLDLEQEVSAVQMTISAIDTRKSTARLLMGDEIRKANRHYIIIPKDEEDVSLLGEKLRKYGCYPSHVVGDAQFSASKYDYSCLNHILALMEFFKEQGNVKERKIKEGDREITYLQKFGKELEHSGGIYCGKVHPSQLPEQLIEVQRVDELSKSRILVNGRDYENTGLIIGIGSNEEQNALLKLSSDLNQLQKIYNKSHDELKKILSEGLFERIKKAREKGIEDITLKSSKEDILKKGALKTIENERFLPCYVLDTVNRDLFEKLAGTEKMMITRTMDGIKSRIANSCESYQSDLVRDIMDEKYPFIAYLGEGQFETGNYPVYKVMCTYDELEKFIKSKANDLEIELQFALKRILNDKEVKK